MQIVESTRRIVVAALAVAVVATGSVHCGRKKTPGQVAAPSRAVFLLDPDLVPPSSDVGHVRVVPAQRGQGPLGAVLGDATAFEMLMALPTVERAIGRYPPDAFLGAQISVIVTPSIDGIDAAGFQLLARHSAAERTFEIAVALRDYEGALVHEDGVEFLLHREFARWALRSVDRERLEAEWTAQLAPGVQFVAPERIGLFWRTPREWRRLSATLLHFGFVDPLALTGFEQDVVYTAARSMRPNRDFRVALSASTALARKVLLVAYVFDCADLELPPDVVSAAESTLTRMGQFPHTLDRGR